jgi:hypothetical protein
MKSLILYMIFGSLLLLTACRVNSSPASNSTDLILNNQAVDIAIVSPSESELWKPGTENLIRWNLSHDISSVTIELYKKDELRLKIAENIGAKSSFVWKIPDDLSPSHHYRLKIFNPLKPVESVFSSYFYIMN